MEKIIVQTPSKKYPIYIGEYAIRLLESFIQEKNYTNIMIITDENVAKLHLSTLLSALPSNKNVFQHIVPAGEQTKSIEVFYQCQTAALQYGLDRQSLIIAFGGGVIGDLAGFVAATFMRGISFIQLPTTLLAHDSAVGGKVAINHALGKNMIGAFYQPEAVFYDIRFLQTLSQDEMRSGFAEVIKHSLIRKPSFYEWLVSHVTDLSDLQGSTLSMMIKRGIETKAMIVSQDEKESGIRAFLNFGHTLAHAIESEMGYGMISHGDAVAIGMLFAIKISEDEYHLSLNYPFLKEWFKKIGYPLHIAKTLSKDRMIKKMKSDKKSQAGKIKMVLLNGIGNPVLKDIEDETALYFLERLEGE